MRILHVLGQRPDMTGSGMFLRNIWRCGAAAGDELHLLCAGYADDDFSGFFGDRLTMIGCGAGGEHPDLIPGMSDVMPYPSSRYADLDAEQGRAYFETFARRVDDLQSTFRPEIIHVHHLWLLAALAARVDVPVVVTVHGTGLQQTRLAPQHLESFTGALGEVALFMAVSDEVAGETVDIHGVGRGRVAVVANGFDEEVFFPPAVEPLAGSSARFGGGASEPPSAGDAHEPAIVAAGKYVEWKGFEHLIRALADPALAGARLTIFGTGPEARRAALVATAEQAGVADRLSLPGHVPAAELAQHLRAADVFALPSVHEPFGLVLLEALACGCPVVASATAGPKLMVDVALIDDGLALLVEPPAGDSDAEAQRYAGELAMALHDVAGRDAGGKERRRIAASVAHLTWTAAYARMRDCYGELD